MVVLGQRCCIREKNVVFGQMWLNSGNIVVLGQSGSTREKLVVFLQSDCIREK